MKHLIFILNKMKIKMIFKWFIMTDFIKIWLILLRWLKWNNIMKHLIFILNKMKIKMILKWFIMIDFIAMIKMK